MFDLRQYFPLLTLVTVVTGSTLASADDDVDFFEQKIRPVLVDYCYKCHSSEADEAAGGLLMDSSAGMRRGGETGPAVVPKDLEESLLLSAIEYRDLEMPPDEKLDDEIIADFRRWIRMGASDPRDGDMSQDTESEPVEATPLWSLQPIRNPAVPTVQNQSWPTSELDQFVLAQLESAGLTPSVPATKETLLRRLSFDLVGLPPTVDEFQTFTASADDAYPALVDRLLTSPQFGERWARHWLDVVRYGESTGSSRDVLMLYSWRYRDYVIDAFNSDMPYDQFVRQQIAGDLLSVADDEDRRRNLIATGLLAIGSKSLNGGNLELDIVDDQVDVISKAFMGFTVACARCHDHKFDPIPTADYYAMAGIFRNIDTFYGGSTSRPKNLKDRLKVYLPFTENTVESAKQVEKLSGELAAIRKKIAPLDKRLKALKKQLPDNWKEVLTALEANDGANGDVEAVAGLSPKDRRTVQQYKEVKDQQSVLNQELKALEKQQDDLPAPEFAFAVQDKKKSRDWPIQVRGEKGKNGDTPPRGFLSCVELPDEFSIPDEQSGRLQLAQWVTHTDHPLTSRVMVNRVWQHLFGTGLVESVNNFGRSGNEPTHPLLLDWLAHRFVHHHRWSVKSLIREIVLSQTYQMSSANNEEGWRQDPSNRLLWRANRRRLEAEAIRDAMLVASNQLQSERPVGSLVQQVGEGEVGRNIDTQPLEEPFPHRSVYLPIIRGLLPEMLKVFDFPEASNPSGQRTVTNVPTQSLFLMNSEFVQQQASDIATRVMESSSDDNDRVRYAWLMCLSREPVSEEVDETLQFLAQLSASPSNGTTSIVDPWQVVCQSLLASAEFRFID
ncbi:MAG: PSD1 and planctomycete cytochrome C domain-containing protein [Fuerstiella sp.]|nr:DUF1553 domain-containing protein [Fuerstiella sp.]